MKNIITRASALFVFFLCLSSISTAQPVLPGSMAGSPDVTSSGAFTYSVPIMLPPGINNLMPQLALVYNSMGGNGPLGMGWSLSGMGEVSRIPSNVYHDGGVNPVNLNGDPDYFAINGDKLISVGGGTYKNPVENFSVIRSFGTIGTSPAYFTVETQDGLVYEYGNSIDSRMLASAGTGEIVKWALNKISDRHGNYINFQYLYSTSAGTHKLDKIEYGGNALVGTPTSCEVSFGYTTRSDNDIRYIFGSRIEEPELLNSITVKYGGTTIHSYALQYGFAFYSLLTKITETGQGGSTLRPTEFTYGASAPMSLVSSTSHSSDPPSTASTDIKVVTSGDFNGDGFTDIVRINRGSPTVTSNYGVNKNIKTDDFLPFTPTLATGPIPIEPGPASPHTNYPGLAEAIVKATLDFNGDGKTDLLTITFNGVWSSGNFVAYIHLANGIGFDAPYPIYSNGGGTDKFNNIKITTGNFLGNGKQQLLLAFPDVPPVVGTPSSSVSYTLHLYGDGGFHSTSTLTHHRAEFRAMDFDGDGKDELFTTLYSVAPPAPTAKIYSFATSFDPATKLPLSGTTVVTNTVNMSYPTYNHRVFYGDFNGDGMQDVLTWEPSLTDPWEIGLSMGNNITKMNVADAGDPAHYLGLQTADPGLTVPITGAVASLTDDNNFRIADFNGDGKDDILEIYSNLGGGVPPYYFKVYYSKGDFKFLLPAELYVAHPTITDINEGSIDVGDFNADGQADVLLHPGGGAGMRLLYFRKNEQSHLLKQIKKNDNQNTIDGQVFSIAYLPITQDSHYDPYSGTLTYPYREMMTGGLKVVKLLQNTLTPLNTSFNYKGCVTHLSGKGFRGFQQFSALNIANIKATVQKFNQVSFENVVPTESSVHSIGSPPGSLPLVSGTVVMGAYYPAISSKAFSYSEDLLPFGIRLIYPTSEATFDYSNNLVSNTSYTYLPTTGSLHAFGKPDKIITDNGYGTEVSEQEFVYNTGAPEFYNRDNPASITVKNTRAGSSTYTRVTSYSYYSHGKPSLMTADPGTSHENQISYTYDSWGNLLSENSVVVPTAMTGINYVYSTDHRFTTQKINTLSHTENFTHDAWGNVLTATNINGITTTNTYDAFNRLTSVVSSATPSITNSITYHWANSPSVTGCPAGIHSIAIEKSTTGILGSGIEFYDYSGNVVRTIHPDFAGNAVYKDATYHPDGKLSTESLPHYLLSPTLTSSYIYDYLGRQYSVTNPATGTTTFSYTPNIFSSSDPFGGMQITATNPTTSKTKQTTIDATGKTTDIMDCSISWVKYLYNSNGKISQTSANSEITDYEYDGYGNLKKETAPNKGVTNYTYDNRNRLKTTTDANSVTFSYGYDALNRMVSKTGPAVAFIYQYDGGGMPSYGKLTGATGPVPTTTVNYIYDAFSRVISKTENIAGGSFTSGYTYDAYNRLLTTTYPDANTLRHEYNSYGHLNGISVVGMGPIPGIVPDLPIWRKNAENVFGQTTDVSMGLDPFVIISTAVVSGMIIPFPITYLPMLYRQERAYSSLGFLASSKLSTPYATLNHNSYLFNTATGNLLTINDVLNTRNETFTYDNLDRLTAASQSGFMITSATQTFSYDTKGNMLKKSNVSTGSNWRYTSYAIDEIPLPTTVIPSFTQTATYTPYDKVETLVEHVNKIDFTYNANEQRGKAEYYTSSALTRTRFYAENYEETTNAATGITQKISYVMAEGQPVAMLVTNGTSPTTIKYIGTDHLGSIMHVLNGTGGTDEDRSYDAWGRMRDPGDWSYPTTPIVTLYDRGYTGQEHLKDFNVINLNGRLYDPLIGRMFSPDKYITNPADGQTYNCYSYCNNNPLKYTDENGDFLLPAFLLFTETGYDVQKHISPVALHLDVRIGTHETGIGADLSVGAPQILPISYRYDVGATYFTSRVGGYGSGWQVRNGSEWGLFGGTIQYGGMRYRDWDDGGLQADQVVHTAQLGSSPLLNIAYSNDTKGSFPWADAIPFIPKLMDGAPYGESDRYRTASGRARLGMYEFGFFLHTGQATREDEINGTSVFAGGNINDPKRSNGMLYFGSGGVKLGFDSEEQRHFIQNRLVHDKVFRYGHGQKYAHVPKTTRGRRFVFQIGGF